MDARFFPGKDRRTSSSRSVDTGATHYKQMCRTLLLLGSLSRGPLYGYELCHMLQEHDNMKMASFRTTLDHLIADRCLYYEIMPALHTGRNKRIYALTHKGYRQFSTLLSDFLLTDTSLPGGIEMALRFLDRLPKTERLTLLRARRCLLTNQRILTVAKLSGPLITATSSYILSYRLCLLDAELAWIDQMVAALQPASFKDAQVDPC